MDLRRLQAGSPVEIVAPAGPFDVEKFRQGISLLEARGFKPRFRDDLFARDGFFAGSDERRARELRQAFRARDADLVWAARGGYGTSRLLESIRVDDLRRANKLFIGFSDLTALHLRLFEARIPSIHGSMVARLASEPAPVLSRLFTLLSSATPAPALVGRPLVRGRAEGLLTGGNLAIIASLCGTPYLPSFEGAVLFLEDVGERPYRLDRMLTQCRQAGVFQGVRALVFGEFTDCDETKPNGTAAGALGPEADRQHAPAGGPTARDVIIEHAQRLGVPCLTDLPCGHGPTNQALPFGVPVRVDAEEASLVFLESPFQEHPLPHRPTRGPTAADDLARTLEAGREAGVYTHASLCVVHDREVRLDLSVPAGRPVFDVASLTKVVTAVATLQRFPLDRRVQWLDGLPTVGQLLSHSAGLPAWRPLFAHAATRLDLPLSRLIHDDSAREGVKRIYREVLAATPANAPRPTYSDLGFLALWLELDDEVLNLPRFTLPVPTGLGRPRPGNPRVEADLVARLGFDAQAQDDAPDDDNAACLGVPCGHAGLFLDALALAQYGDRLRRDADEDSGGLLPREKAQMLFTRVAGSRTYGLDTPSGDAPALGSLLGRGPKGAAGHLGFTGTSLWIDRDAKLSIAFLTNAVFRERPSDKIRAFRPIVHDLVARSLGLG